MSEPKLYIEVEALREWIRQFRDRVGIAVVTMREGSYEGDMTTALEAFEWAAEFMDDEAFVELFKKEQP